MDFMGKMVDQRDNVLNTLMRLFDFTQLLLLPASLRVSSFGPSSGLNIIHPLLVKRSL
jgi:hypothetical protein